MCVCICGDKISVLLSVLTPSHIRTFSALKMAEQGERGSTKGSSSQEHGANTLFQVVDVIKMDAV